MATALGSPISVRTSKRHGRGVFADQPISRGSLIEVCPTLEFAPDVANEGVYGYCFGWEDWGKGYRLALGYGSLYNHSYDPNAVYESFVTKEEIRVYARRNIAKGEEITFNYNCDPNSQEALWFDVQ